jgi:hypothetical protein
MVHYIMPEMGAHGEMKFIKAISRANPFVRYSNFPLFLLSSLSLATTTMKNPAAGKRFEPMELENAYKVIMRLTINSVSQNDFGAYRCVSKNSLGDTDGAIKLYREYHKLCNYYF